MFLDYIEITNFRPYYGTQKIEFGYNEDENLTVILADNGSGKTSLVNALTWCLYGEELHDVRDKSEPLYNLSAASDAEKNDSSVSELIVEVKIRFYDIEDSTKKYFIVNRKSKYQKWGSANWTANFDDYLIVEEKNNILEDDIAQESINNKIPRNMFQYFFFNGATLSNYFNNGSDLNLRNSIEEISQIDLINNVWDHLDKTYKKINRDYSNKLPNENIDYSKLIEEKSNEMNDLIQRRQDNYNQIDIANTNINRANKKLDEIDSNNIKELNIEREGLTKEINSIDIDINIKTKEYDHLILELFPIASLSDQLFKFLEIAIESKEKKTAPPEIERDLLNDILEDGVCICGTDLKEHPECIKELESRLKNTSKVKKDTFYEDFYQVKNVLCRLKDLPKIESIKESIEKLKSEKITLISKINNISEMISSSDEEDARFYEDELIKNKNNKESLRSENVKLTSKIESLEKEIKKLKEDWDKEIKMEEELKFLKDKSQFCQEALSIIANLKDDVKDHIRSKVNNKTREQFISINWANNKYIDVNIEPNYTIEITKKNGQKVKPGDLSDGEENLLALSFMMALHSLSGFEIPLIIDAPLEKLDKGKRIDFISGLHDYTKDKQIIFLFTDSQYTSDVRANMLKNVVDEYSLRPYENKTEIVKHGKN